MLGDIRGILVVARGGSSHARIMYTGKVLHGTRSVGYGLINTASASDAHEPRWQSKCGMEVRRSGDKDLKCIYDCFEAGGGICMMR